MNVSFRLTLFANQFSISFVVSCELWVELRMKMKKSREQIVKRSIETWWKNEAFMPVLAFVHCLCFMRQVHNLILAQTTSSGLWMRIIIGAVMLCWLWMKRCEKFFYLQKSFHFFSLISKAATEMLTVNDGDDVESSFKMIRHCFVCVDDEIVTNS